MPEPQRHLIDRGWTIDLALQAVLLGDGTEAERQVVLHRGAGALVPMADRDHVCLVRNRRYAVGRTLPEVPAGTAGWHWRGDLTSGVPSSRHRSIPPRAVPPAVRRKSSFHRHSIASRTIRR